MALSNEDIRTGFNQMIQAARAAGDAAAVDNMTLGMEFFTNPAFRQALSDQVWEQTQKMGRSR